MEVEVAPLCREQVSATCQCIAVAAFTGEIGDGKIFILPVADIIRMCASFLYTTDACAPVWFCQARKTVTFSRPTVRS